MSGYKEDKREMDLLREIISKGLPSNKVAHEQAVQKEIPKLKGVLFRITHDIMHARETRPVASVEAASEEKERRQAEREQRERNLANQREHAKKLAERKIEWEYITKSFESDRDEKRMKEREQRFRQKYKDLFEEEQAVQRRIARVEAEKARTQEEKIERQRELDRERCEERSSEPWCIKEIKERKEKEEKEEKLAKERAEKVEKERDEKEKIKIQKEVKEREREREREKEIEERNLYDANVENAKQRFIRELYRRVLLRDSCLIKGPPRIKGPLRPEEIDAENRAIEHLAYEILPKYEEYLDPLDIADFLTKFSSRYSAVVKSLYNSKHPSPKYNQAAAIAVVEAGRMGETKRARRRTSRLLQHYTSRHQRRHDLARRISDAHPMVRIDHPLTDEEEIRELRNMAKYLKPDLLEQFMTEYKRLVNNAATKWKRSTRKSHPSDPSEPRPITRLRRLAKLLAQQNSYGIRVYTRPTYRQVAWRAALAILPKVVYDPTAAAADSHRKMENIAMGLTGLKELTPFGHSLTKGAILVLRKHSNEIIKYIKRLSVDEIMYKFPRDYGYPLVFPTSTFHLWMEGLIGYTLPSIDRKEQQITEHAIRQLLKMSASVAIANHRSRLIKGSDILNAICIAKELINFGGYDIKLMAAGSEQEFIPSPPVAKSEFSEQDHGVAKIVAAAMLAPRRPVDRRGMIIRPGTGV
jgi:hypothetical protein